MCTHTSLRPLSKSTSTVSSLVLFCSCSNFCTRTLRWVVQLNGCRCICDVPKHRKKKKPLLLTPIRMIIYWHTVTMWGASEEQFWSTTYCTTAVTAPSTQFWSNGSQQKAGGCVASKPHVVTMASVQLEELYNQKQSLEDELIFTNKTLYERHTSTSILNDT